MRLGSLTLQPGFEVLRTVSAIDVHLMAGNYDGEYDTDDLTAGALCDNGLAVFSFGLMGQNLDDIGQSIAGFIRRKYPDFHPRKGIEKIFAEARRVLKPGGLMLHMELPPNSQLSPYDAFYLDWDSFYNNEPFYKPFRDLKPEELCRRAGFDRRKYVQFVIPSVGWYGKQVWSEAVERQDDVDSDKTGRLTDGVRWYCFGAWK